MSKSLSVEGFRFKKQEENESRTDVLKRMIDFGITQGLLGRCPQTCASDRNPGNHGLCESLRVSDAFHTCLNSIYLNLIRLSYFKFTLFSYMFG